MQIPMRRRVADCTEGAQQRVLLDAGNTAEVLDVHQLSQVAARDSIELIDNLLIALDPPSRHD
jgi:hypothetical protein